ncbi:MAG: hypothetical protein E6Q58_04280 [Niabella sp.]|nr:MAG: hypothetical protein E6Q58_04280 [Niabella sp.]
MSEKTSHSSSSKLEATVKGLKEELRFIRKFLILNRYGKYDKKYENEVSDLINSGEKSSIEISANGFNTTHAAIIAGSILISSIIVLVGVIGAQTKTGRTFLTEKMKLQLGDASTAPIAMKSPDSTAPKGPKIAKVSVDNDPVLGDPNAPVTLIEFSDFDCPWCKTFFDQVFPQFKKNYIDTGKVKMVFRDLPLESLHPDSKTKSLAANCALEQGGSELYYKFHDELFKRAPTPGTGKSVLNRADIDKIAKDLGMDAGAFKTCLDTKKYDDEINQDIQAAFDLESYGTPSFYVGKSSSNGVIEGEALEGYAPYANFSQYIERALKK